MIIKGRIKRILSQKNSFFLFSLECEIGNIPEDKINPRYPSSVTVLGNFVELEEEYIIEIEGEWEYKPTKDGKYHPWSFRAINYTVLENESPAIIIKKLAGLPEMDTYTAIQIYERWENDSLTLIESSEYMALTEIRGITAEKANILHQAYIEKKSLQYLKNLLEPYGVSDTKIQQIQKRWENPIMVIESNPYMLSNEDLVSFNVADRIAKDFGFNAMSETRIESLLLYILGSYASSKGHTYLPLDELVDIATKMQKNKNVALSGEISESFFINKVEKFVKDGIMVNEEGKIYHLSRYISECSVANWIRRRATLNNPFSIASDEQIERCVSKAEKTLGVTLAEMQREAAIVAAKSLTTVVTGGPGMGKTTCLKALLLTLDYLTKELELKEFHKTLAAPSGMAAKRMKESTGLDASTIHRMLDYKPCSNGKIQCKDVNNPIETDIIVLDESSMIDIDLMYLVSEAIKDETMLIFVGDTDQLPSVGPGNVLHDIIDSGAVPVVRLNQTYRQGSESAILANANKIRDGHTDLLLDKSDFTFVSIPDSEDTDGTILSETVQRVFFEEFIERGEDISKVQILCPMRKRSERLSTLAVVNEMNFVLQETVNPCLDSTMDMKYGNNKYRKGDKIMQLANNYEKNVFNGDVGIIKEVSPNNSKMLVDFQGEMVEYTKNELDQIQLSFATTIHKSQGSEYPCVIIPITMQHKNMLQRNLIYTAITRAKSKVYVIGDWEAFQYSICNVSNRQRNSYLVERIRKKEEKANDC